MGVGGIRVSVLEERCEVQGEGRSSTEASLLCLTGAGFAFPAS